MTSINLPKLSGSEKQIAWAEQIRSKLVKSYASIESTLTATAQSTAALQSYRAMFESIVSSAYYIENRTDFIPFVNKFFADAKEKGIVHIDREKMEFHFDSI